LAASATLLLSRLRHRKVRLEHDPEKWKPVFRKDHAPSKPERQLIQPKTIPL
jgi:hypothetical protein